MNAVNLLCDTAEAAYWRGQKDQEFRKPMRVGEFYEKLPGDVKEVLRTLKSDDARKVRFDGIAWMCHPVIFPHKVVIA